MAIKFVDRVPTYPGRIKFTKEDGTVIYGTWERADSPTVEGTPLNAENLNAMQEGGGLSEPVTYYVDSVGSDTTGDGTEAKPYATVTKALSLLPKNLNGFNATIFVASGTYNEAIQISNFVGGTIILRGYGADATFYYIEIMDSNVEVRGLTLTVDRTGTKSAALYMLGGRLRCFNDFNTTNPSTGIKLEEGARLLMGGATVRFSGASYGVSAEHGSHGVFGTLAGSATTLLSAGTGSIIAYDTVTATVTVATSETNGGGRIFAGSQTT